MSKLQQIKRSNGSIVTSVNIPLEEFERTGWKKGDNVLVTARLDNLGKWYIIIVEGET